MCGIAGFTRFRSSADEPSSLLTRMGNAIRHRGPDASGQFVDDGIALCHQRLSIIDLSDSGSQPMTSHCGRYVIIFNGEIYNFQALRSELNESGVQFSGHSDTEVLLALYEQQGPACLNQLNGMFAFAIWDRRKKSLFLARDRLGKKPLYVYQYNGQFIFASELKAILALPEINREIRTDALRDYFTYHYVPDPKSIFQHINKLAPGCWMQVDASGSKQTRYWDVSFANVTSRSQSNIEEDLYSLLEDSVRIRMISDVPFGAFLSGGVDSSAVVGLMANNSEQAVTTCSIGFNSKIFDEVKFAKTIAEQFGTDHNEFTVRENVENSLLDIAAFFDEPFADASFIPTYFVSRLARRKVTVALAGDGGDENFAGYAKYKIDRTENRLRSIVPAYIRSRVFPTISGLLENTGNSHARRARSLLGSLSVSPDMGFFISNSFFDENLWQQLANEKLKHDLADYNVSEVTRNAYHAADAEDHLSRILYTDIKTYLPGDILVKVDRMSMANSLETRAPILDYRIVEYAASISPKLKLCGNESKYILKKSMSGMLSEDILYRKKMGFSVPMAQWLRHEIKTTVERYLFRPHSGLSIFSNVPVLKDLWDQHQSGQRNLSQEIWSLFMFEVWWQTYMETTDIQP
jgi:asparagine synthase (glutamine-hydrolysing)